MAVEHVDETAYIEDRTRVGFEPVPVIITETSLLKHKVSVERIDSPEFTGWATYILAGIGDIPQRILPLNPLRHKATVIVQPGNAGAVIGFVRIGNRDQVTNTQGAKFVNGNSFTVDSSAETWLMSDGTNSLQVTVIDEQYRSST